MKLKQIKTGTFTFRKVLPEYCLGLGPDDCKEVFVEIEGRLGAAMNQKYIADAEAVAKKAVVMDKKREILVRKAETSESDAAALVEKSMANSKVIAADQFGITYDNCVAAWSTNICDEAGEVLTPTRANFIGLAQVSLAPIADVFTEFMAELESVSKISEQADEDDLKN